MNYSQSVVDGLYLFNQSDNHSVYTLQEFNRYLIYPLLHDKLRIFYEHGKPVSLVTWVWFTDQQSEWFLDETYEPVEEDYNGNWSRRSAVREPVSRAGIHP